MSYQSRTQYHRFLRASLFLPLFFALSLVPSISAAQQTMTIEELEAFIEEQKAALAQVEANRAETAEKAAEVNAELKKQEARQAEIEAEFKALCEEQDKLNPGSLDACLAELAK